MTAPKIKATYTLDAETVKLIDRLARRWKTSKSDTLRRVVREAAADHGSSPDDPEAWIEKFKRLQKSFDLTEMQAKQWRRENRAVRRASSDHRGR